MTRISLMRSALVLALTAGALTMLDVFLARTETREVHEEAASAYGRGLLLLNQGKAEQALPPLRKAYVLARENPGYGLQLGNALARVGKFSEARSLIGDALIRQPNDGEANLATAHLLVREGTMPDANAYFHRAIYGEWRDLAAAHRIAARMELIALLAEEKRPEEMLAELISLEEETHADAGKSQDKFIDIRKRLAHFFMLAGAPARAAKVYRELAESGASDDESLFGLGEAELESGRYRLARNAFLRASLHHPGVKIQSRLLMVETLTSLDPTPRQLTSVEKYRRSRRILDLTRADFEQHLKSSPRKASDETNQLLTQTTDALAGKEPAHLNNELAEKLLALAQHLWRSRIRIFGESVAQEEEPLRLILERLSG